MKPQKGNIAKVPSDLSQVLQNRTLPSLNGIRAAAVFTVIVFHFGIGIPGDLGVTGFFVLSGFLITLLLLREHATTGVIDLRSFYVRRTLRIFPAYYVYLLVALVVVALTNGRETPSMFISASLYVMNYYNAFHEHKVTFLSHTWSLACEEQFYLLWPVTFLLLLRWGRHGLLVGISTIVVAIVAWRCVLYFYLDASTARIYDAFDTRADCLLVGCFLAIALTNAKLRNYAQRLGAVWWAPFITLGLLFCSRVASPISWIYTFGFSVDACLIAILIVQLLCLHTSIPWVWLDHPVLNYLGRISYPLYLYQQITLKGGKHLFEFAPVPVQFLFAVLLTIAAAAISYHLVEMPFLQLKERFKTRSAVPTSAS